MDANPVHLYKTEIVFKSLYLPTLNNAPEVYDSVFSVPLSILVSEVLIWRSILLQCLLQSIIDLPGSCLLVSID